MSIKLNEKLLEAVLKRKIDLVRIKNLLAEGADPLGVICEDGDGYDTVLAGLLSEWDSHTMDNSRLPEVIQLFIDNGMDPKCIPAETMWCFTFCSCREMTVVFRILFAAGLSVSQFDEYLGHTINDLEMCDGFILEDEKFETNSKVMLDSFYFSLMLAASYKFSEGEFIRECMETDTTNKVNAFDISRFKNTEDYYIEYDFSTCTIAPYGIQMATVIIKEKLSGETVWVTHV